MIFQRDQLYKVVCNIRSPQVDGSERLGTGIFIKNKGKHYILTAAHVAKDINQMSYLILSDQNSKPIKLAISEITDKNFENHPVADLSKLEITKINNPIFQQRFYPIEQVDFSEIEISKDLELTVIGFPNGLGFSSEKFSPLTFRTYVSSPSISLKRFDENVVSEFIVLEQPGMGGYSGGPLFDLGYQITGALTTKREMTKLYGVVHGTIGDTTGGKLAAITPAKYLKNWI